MHAKKRALTTSMASLCISLLSLFIVPNGTLAADGKAQLSLTWPTGATQAMTGGPHNNDPLSGANRPWNSLDLAGGDGGVYAARGGIAYLDCPGGGRVRIDHGDGYQTTYYHLSSIAIANGVTVSRGQRIGNQGDVSPCGGGADGVHVHFSIWLVTSGAFDYGSNEVAMDQLQLSGWVISKGAFQYDGCATSLSSGVQYCLPPNVAMYNDGSIPGVSQRPLGALTFGAGSALRSYAFVVSSSGGLEARYYNGSAWSWMAMCPTPATVADGADAYTWLNGATRLFHVLARLTNGDIGVCWSSDGTTWSWTSLGHPPNTSVAGGVAAYQWLASSQQWWNVWVWGTDGHLWRYVKGGTTDQWVDAGLAGGSVRIVAGLGGYTGTGGSGQFVWAADANGNVQAFYAGDGLNFSWAPFTPPGTTAIGGVGSYTWVGTDTIQRNHTWVVGSNGRLLVLYYPDLAGNAWAWLDLGSPGRAVGSGVGAYTWLTSTGQQLVYSWVLGSDGTVQVAYFDGVNWGWAQNLPAAPDGPARVGTGAYQWPEGTTSYFHTWVTMANGKLDVEYYPSGTGWGWASMGIPP